VAGADEEITSFSREMPWQVLGQWRNSFIIAGSAEELIIIDQHVAHERVLYEEYLNQLAAGDVPRQKLLVPINVELTPAQMLLLEKIEGRFEDNGFEIEPFGPRSVVVKAVPAVASRCEADQLLFEILERIENAPDDYSVEEVHRRTAAGLSCRAAVKMNTPLTQAKMEHLVNMLLATEEPTTCPHGRPVVLKLGIRELEKSFKRI
jgi:DNA mismatch repair protein MutL